MDRLTLYQYFPRLYHKKLQNINKVSTNWEHIYATLWVQKYSRFNISEFHFQISERGKGEGQFSHKGWDLDSKGGGIVCDVLLISDFDICSLKAAFEFEL